MKSFIKILTICLTVLTIVSCTGEKSKTRQVQYMADTDMYNPVGYETYGEDAVFKDSMAAQLPVAGTIARGTELPFEYGSSQAEYDRAKDSLRSPLKVTQANLDNGKKMYNIYCASCHGTKGDGQGPLVQNEKFLGVPNYKDRDITQGTIYHVIMHGKGVMGSHSSQLKATERWQIVQYVEKLRNDMLKK